MKRIFTYIKSGGRFLYRLLRLQITYLYVLYSIDTLWAAKIGISDAPRVRKSYVETDLERIKGKPIRLLFFAKIPMPFAFVTEQALHRFFAGLRTARYYGSSGHTEWFFTINILVGFLVGLFAWAYGRPCPYAYGAVAVFFPMPLDFALFALLLGAAQWAFVFGVLYLTLYFLFA